MHHFLKDLFLPQQIHVFIKQMPSPFEFQSSLKYSPDFTMNIKADQS